MSDKFTPIVSIITPAYNAARYIRQAIESVQAQTYTQWEMIIVDDSSTDETTAVVKDLAGRDERIHLVRHKTNKGPAASRNTALKLAQGRYIAFLDSDDLWLPDKLEKQLRFMQKTGAAFSYSRYRRIKGESASVGHLVIVPEKLTYSDLLKNTAISTSTVLIDRNITGKFEMVKTYYDDFALWLQLLKRGFSAYGLQEDLVRYRIVGKSVSRNKLRSAAWVWRTYRDIERLNIFLSLWYFTNYAKNALWKYRKF